MQREKDIEEVIDSKNVIDEISRLLDIDFDDTIFRTCEHHKKTIDQAQKELNQKRGIPSEKADREIDQ